MKESLQKIGEIIDDSNCSQFVIIGYKHVDVMIKLIYHDCNEYYIIKYIDDKYEVCRLGYGFDRDYSTEIDKFNGLYNEIDNTDIDA